MYPGEVVRFTGQNLAASQDPSSPARPDPGPAEADPVTAVPAAAITSASGVFSCSALEALWDEAGGTAAAAFTAVEIAMAECSGDADAISPTDDFGLWQITAVTARATLDCPGPGSHTAGMSTRDPWSPPPRYRSRPSNITMHSRNRGFASNA